MNSIETSVFDLFKIGPGPSSSHTIGPMRAGLMFLEAAGKLPAPVLARADAVRVRLFGSLSSTGRGHGTDRSVLAGLLGWTPESCDSAAFSKLLKGGRKYSAKIGGRAIVIRPSDIVFDDGPTDGLPYQNTLRISLLSGGDVLLEKEYYSIGGGFVLAKGARQAARARPCHEYSDMEGLKRLLKARKLSLPRLMEKNESQVSGESKEVIRRRLSGLISAMSEAVDRGLRAKGVLPGPIKLSRKAHVLFKKASSRKHIHDRFLALLNAYALAASEENAAGNRVVTAPTSGSSGVIPAAVYLLKNHFYYTEEKIHDGLLAAAAIGFIAKHNASISGAEVGCQGEIGVASAMAAAFFAAANGHPIEIIENAAEIALEHHLGLTCDPVDGYVQIPCIERNAIGVVTAYNAFLLASAGDPHKQKIGFDDVVKAMLRTGRDMSTKYKETAKGGLALCKIKC